MNRALVLTGAATTGVVGLAIARWLAGAAVYAERVEEEQYCRPVVGGHPAAA